MGKAIDWCDVASKGKQKQNKKSGSRIVFVEELLLHSLSSVNMTLTG